MWMMWCVKVDHNTGVYVPYSFRTVVWVLLRPTRTDQWKCCETGPTVFRPYPRRLESLTVCRCHYKGSTFLVSYFKTLSVGPAAVRTRDLPLSKPALSQLNQPNSTCFIRTLREYGHMPPSVSVLTVFDWAVLEFISFLLSFLSDHPAEE